MSSSPTDKAVISALRGIESGQHSREQLITIRDNAKASLTRGNIEAQFVIDAINKTSVSDIHKRYFFMGFCPGADFQNRQDIKWIEEGVCEFTFFDSEPQYDRFCKIMVGDRLILKKRESFGKTMKLYAHGIVTEIVPAGINEKQSLRVGWHKPSNEIIVPLMACNSTVDVKLIKTVEQEMPSEFWEWLKS